MNVSQRIVITSTSVQREVEISADAVNIEERETQSYLLELGKRAPLETGILPAGILSIRQGGDHLQIVHQSEPDINYIHWGERESDPNAEVYTLAQPYRIAIGDFIDGNLLGCRMFYSPTPITSLDQPLYHQNVPNINCLGYGQYQKTRAGGNGVGWVCLYHTESWQDLNIADKAIRMIERCSGNEAYNDRNMSETDGTRFYQNAGKPAYLWNPKAWEKKSKEEGFEWTLDPALWIPVLVESEDKQDKHYPDGVPLTLRMAMEGNAAAYYGDDYLPKPINAIARPSQQLNVKDIHQKVYNEAFVRAKPLKSILSKKKTATVEPKPKAVTLKKVASKKIVQECFACNNVIVGNAALLYDGTGIKYKFCKDCIVNLKLCTQCSKIWQLQDLMPAINGGEVCIECAPYLQCTECALVYTGWLEGKERVCASHPPAKAKLNFFKSKQS